MVRRRVGRTSEVPQSKTPQALGIILKVSKQKIILHPLCTILIYNKFKVNATLAMTFLLSLTAKSMSKD